MVDKYDKFKNAKILITGSSGFIGISLCNKLKELGSNVTCFDPSSGHNICNDYQIKNIIKHKFDIVYHLAGLSGSAESNIDRISFFKINTLATINLCELILHFSPMTKLILSGSRLEYGNPKYLPVDEKHPTNPNSIYGLSKLFAHEVALRFYYKNGLDVTIFRTSNVYGPHPKFKFKGFNVINHFIDLATNNKELVIYGSGNQKRDYIFIDDAIEAFILAYQKKSAGKIYNLGFGRSISFKKMVELIVEIVGRGKIVNKDWPRNYQEVETGSYISDISKIRKELGFVPKVDFKEGVKRSITFL